MDYEGLLGIINERQRVSRDYEGLLGIINERQRVSRDYERASASE